MHHGGRPSAGRSKCAWAQAVAVAVAGLLAFGGVAVAAPGGDPGPPEQAQGNGPPATPPGQAKKQETPAATTGGDAHGKSTGGHAKAQGWGHTGGSGQAAAGGQGSSGSQGRAVGKTGGHANVNSQQSNGHAGKQTLCHATGSSTNPYVEITISNNGVPAHDRHQNDEDIIPAPAGGCPGGSSGAKEHGNGNEHGKVTICHATGSETNPYVLITVSENAVPAHTRHQDGEDIVNPTGDCPSSAIPAGLGNPPSGITSEGTTQLAGAPEAGAPESGVLGVSEESGSGPADEGGVLGAQDEGGVAGATQIADTSGGSLPFTGLGLGILVALGALLGLTGLALRRRATE